MRTRVKLKNQCRNDDNDLDEKPYNSVLAAKQLQTSLRSKLPPKMIITSANLRLGELIGQGMGC